LLEKEEEKELCHSDEGNKSVADLPYCILLQIISLTETSSLCFVHLVCTTAHMHHLL